MTRIGLFIGDAVGTDDKIRGRVVRHAEEAAGCDPTDLLEVVLQEEKTRPGRGSVLGL